MITNRISDAIKQFSNFLLFFTLMTFLTFFEVKGFLEIVTFVHIFK